MYEGLTRPAMASMLTVVCVCVCEWTVDSRGRQWPACWLLCQSTVTRTSSTASPSTRCLHRPTDETAADWTASEAWTASAVAPTSNSSSHHHHGHRVTESDIETLQSSCTHSQCLNNHLLCEQQLTLWYSSFQTESLGKIAFGYCPSRYPNNSVKPLCRKTLTYKNGKCIKHTSTNCI